LKIPDLLLHSRTFLHLVFTITAGAPTQLLTKNLPPVIFGVAAGDFTQAAVNALLAKDSTGADLSATSTAEIDTTVAFGSTAMGVDAFGFVISCAGQIDDVLGMEATLYDAEQDNFVPKGRFASQYFDSRSACHSSW